MSPLLTLPCLPAPGACHKKNYDNRDTVCRMLKAQNFQITAQGLELPDGISPLKSVPSELVPHCPVCGAPMSMNLRADDTFVEDEGWHMAAGCYEEFLHRHKGEHILFWELGVGENTPGIIKYPFWRITYQNSRAVFACVNLSQAFCPREIQEQAICIDGDTGTELKKLLP